MTVGAKGGRSRGALSAKTPILRNGDHLSRIEFERRYELMPDVKKAELIEGVVYMPSRVPLSHAEPHAHVVGWLGYYSSKVTPLLGGISASVRLDLDNEPQPDALLLLPEWAGSSARVDKDDFVFGPPDFIAEVAANSASIDLHAKMNAYRRNGVKEYLVWRVEDGAIDWFELVEGRYEAMPVDENGRLRSKVFPGLWLDVAALLAGDLAKVFAAVDAGTATEEHKEFVRNLMELAAKQPR